jgi:E3 ubiquitin-protein ligase TRIP12
MLARQLKLRLISDDNDIPRSCSNIVVSIHAIATFQAFNDYLRPRIAAGSTIAERASISAPSGSSSDRLSGALAAFAAASSFPSPSPGTPPSRLGTSLTTAGSAASQAGADAGAEAESSGRRRSSRISAGSGHDGHQEYVFITSILRSGIDVDIWSLVMTESWKIPRVNALMSARMKMITTMTKL